MNIESAIVVTSINPPTEAMKELARGAQSRRIPLIVIGDEKSPVNFELDGAQFVSLLQQRATGFSYAAMAPTRHYSRKNVGYLIAMKMGARVIIETDDDNIPLPGFWEDRDEFVRELTLGVEGWTNVYSHFHDSKIWPRGLPLDCIRQQGLDAAEFRLEDIRCPIQQGLADGNPDVDAIFRLAFDLPLFFDQKRPIVLSRTWSPFNSQNTRFWKIAFPLLYLPYSCSFRMTDIWRSFVAQRIVYHNGWGVLFHHATVAQDRNEHNLLHDFEDEIPGYLHNSSIRERLLKLDLPQGAKFIPDAMRLAYQALIDMRLIAKDEMLLLNAWLDDVASLNQN